MPADRIPTTREQWAEVKPTNEDCSLVEVWHRGEIGCEAYAPGVYPLAKLVAAAREAEHERCAHQLAGYLSTLPGHTDKHPAEMLPEARRLLEAK